MKVLIVDDDDGIRETLSIALSVEERVDEVMLAASGPDALRICRDYAPDVIVLDYWMPAMDGGTAAVLMRAMRPRARIVAFSGALDSKPEWADEYFVKGEIPDMDALLTSP